MSQNILEIEEALKKIIDSLPEFCRADDLIDVGLYQSRSDLSHAIARGIAPPHLKFGPKKTLFPRPLLCGWLLEYYRKTNSHSEVNHGVIAGENSR